MRPKADARDYFSADELGRASRFRRGQRALALVTLAIEGALLGAAARRRPSTGAAALNAAAVLATLPPAVLARRRAQRVGLDTQSWPGWLRDMAVAQALTTPLLIAAKALVTGAQRRYGTRWWVPGAAGASAAAGLGLIVGPTLIQPLFNDFEPADDELGERVSAIAERAGVRVDRVLVMDASKRTTGANAYVTGLGPTKRVVLFDTLVRDFSPDEVDFVVAHELAHVRHRDVAHGLQLFALASPAFGWATAQVARRLGDSWPAVNLAFGIVLIPLQPVGAALSRRIERRADRFALAVIDNPRTQVDFQRRACVKNVAEPEPPRWVQFVSGTHPTTLERIAMAECAS